MQVADVVRGMAGGVGHAKALHRLAALEHVQAILGHGRHLAPQLPHVVAVEAPGALEQLGGIDQVPGAALVDVDLQLRIAPAKDAGGARVVEVNVGEQQRARLHGTEPVEQRVKARRGPGIDDQAVDLEGTDHPVAAQVQDIYRS